MIIGACKAARQDNNKFNNINGYGSISLPSFIIIVFNTIQNIKKEQRRVSRLLEELNEKIDKIK